MAKHEQPCPEFTDIFKGFRIYCQQVEAIRLGCAHRDSKSKPIPVPTKTDAEAWKEELLKQHPESDTSKSGIHSWPQYKAFKGKLDAGKPKATQTNSRRHHENPMNLRSRNDSMKSTSKLLTAIRLVPLSVSQGASGVKLAPLQRGAQFAFIGDCMAA